MKKYLIKIFSITLALWMVVITGGLHFYVHYCGCCDVQEISLNDFDECCTGNDHQHTCVEAEAGCTDSCSGQQTLIDLVEGEGCPANNCCDVTHSYLKIDDSFDRAANLILKLFPVSANLTREINLEIAAEQYFQKLSTVNDSPPPGFTGKSFLIFAHRLKIPVSF
ncbi:MAG: hypothetical protein B6D64_03650 [Bacteroidetes bacterium 4484_276]|nr:MAG: hypothetical protein B6D64_03650 [Bacteroidetes bacterium 4484_276]